MFSRPLITLRTVVLLSLLEDVGSKGGCIHRCRKKWIGDFNCCLETCKRGCSNTIGKSNYVKSFLAGFSHSGFYATVCHESCQSYSLNTMGLQLFLQICVWKGTEAMLANHNNILRLRFHGLTDSRIPRTS